MKRFKFDGNRCATKQNTVCPLCGNNVYSTTNNTDYICDCTYHIIRKSNGCMDDGEWTKDFHSKFVNQKNKKIKLIKNL